MDVYIDIVYRINGIFIKGLFISILTMLIFRLFLKERANTKLAAIIVRWIMIVYCSMALIGQLLIFFMPSSEEYAISNRATGPYWWAYWLMMISHSVLPLILLSLYRRFNLWFLLCLSLIMNLGWLFESFVIHTTSIHMDFAPWKSDNNPYLPNPTERLTILRGFVLGIIIFLAANTNLIVSVIKRKFQNR